MTDLREPNVEAGDYIEDDPAAWTAWLGAVRRYGPDYAKLAEHLGTEDAAASVVAAAILSFLADEHGLYLRREPEVVAENRAALVADASELPRTLLRAYDLSADRPDIRAHVRAALETHRDSR